MPTLATVLSFVTLFAGIHAIRIPFKVVHAHDRPASHGRRDTVNATISIIDSTNSIYLGAVVIGGTNYNVQLDTGSSDLWIQGNPANSKDLGIETSITYAIGSAQGEISTAPVTFAGYNVSNQMYLRVGQNATFSSGLFSTGATGILGLGPSSGSILRGQIGNASADALVDRIFEQDPTTPNFVSFLLERLGDGAPVNGQLTVGDIVPGYEAISSQPQLPVIKLKSILSKDQHWTTYVDGIIGPDNSTISYSSSVPSTPTGKLVTIVDSGFTLPQIPRAMSDAIYGRVQGASFDTQHEWWTVPCNQYLNISVVMGGVTFPVHPLDTISSDFGLKDINGNTVCLGTFQPITTAFSVTNEFDMILGDAFLRNSYTLLNYGDFISNGTTSNTADPYMQLLSITDPVKAMNEFIGARLQTYGPINYSLLPASQQQHSPVPAGETVAHYEADVLRYLPEIIVGCAAVLLLIVGCIIWRCCCTKRQRLARAQKKRGMYSESKADYRQIDEPGSAPMGMTPLYTPDLKSPGKAYYPDPYHRF
ncbi:acid protease [Dacryopinax primogenitus]|uniref:Acid protease n=1 Tax=Dacryopinax primogenitus (strain DJM 731) TaxID=1858805 RepID=M5GDW1_DACPD|nr:acid protease [Dacryopinax primogenitus]EJU02738.1 acid protease [Dacryopinax primogenitus]